MVIQDILTCLSLAKFTKSFLRLYIIQGGKVAMKGGEGPLNYKLEDAADWLQEHFRE